jgi:PhnB protein
VCGANPKRDADPSVPGPCAIAAPGRGSTIFQICVDDLEKTVARAVAGGATIRTPVQDADWGDRVATIVDPFGQIWSIAAIRDWLSVPDYNARGNIQLIEAA